jgi:hypothetical protein
MRRTTFGLVAWLATVSAAEAEIFRVGPTGNFDTIQQALDRAVATPVSFPYVALGHDIQLVQGTYEEIVTVPDGAAAARPSASAAASLPASAARSSRLAAPRSAAGSGGAASTPLASRPACSCSRT